MYITWIYIVQHMINQWGITYRARTRTDTWYNRTTGNVGITHRGHHNTSSFRRLDNIVVQYRFMVRLTAPNVKNPMGSQSVSPNQRPTTIINRSEYIGTQVFYVDLSTCETVVSLRDPDVSHVVYNEGYHTRLETSYTGPRPVSHGYHDHRSVYSTCRVELQRRWMRFWLKWASDMIFP